MIDDTAAPAPLDYEVLRLIGRGGYGEVWLVRDKTWRHLACKVIYRVSFSSDRPYEREYEGIKNFEPVSRANESQVNILHVGRRDEAGYFYYIMELADDVASGQQIDPNNYTPKTLHSELKRRGRLPAGECVRIGLSLSAALENLHEHGLIHRDIKPANIIFVNGIPKLADIGLVSNRDVTVSYVGTEGYIPPEGPGSAPADVFGLGKVLYEMGTGKDRLDYPELPADLGTAAEQAALLELNLVLLKACERDVHQRYHTAAELHADLTLLGSGKSIRARNRTRQSRRTLARVAIVALLVLVAVAGYLHGPKKMPPNEAKIPLSTSAELARVSVRLGFDAFGANDYQKASELARTALTAAQTAGSPHLLTEAEFLQSEIVRCQPEYDKVADQFRLLAEKPDDPKANTGVGKFLCLMKNDWATGLPMLARGDNETIRAAAEKELNQAEAAGIGDAWWTAARQTEGAEKTGFQQRARNCYLKAIANAAEPDKTRLRQTLAKRLLPLASPPSQIFIMSRVGNAQHIDIYPGEVRWKSEGVSFNDRINHLIIGDLKGKGSRTIKNSGATRLFPEWADLSTAQMTIDRKARRRGKATLEILDDHVRVNLSDKPAGASEIDVTITFGRRP